MTYGYIRVSSTDQNEDRQSIAMSDLKIPSANIYMDKQSGKDFDRVAYTALVEKMRPGDLLYIKSIDRLGRNYEEIQNQWRIITKEKQAAIVVLDIPLLSNKSYNRGYPLKGHQCKKTCQKSHTAGFSSKT